jgi:hypothetical protein
MQILGTNSEAVVQRETQAGRRQASRKQAKSERKAATTVHKNQVLYSKLSLVTLLPYAHTREFSNTRSPLHSFYASAYSTQYGQR